MKQCCACKNEQPLTVFRKQAKSKDGLNPMCRTCINAYQRKWRKKNPTKTHKYGRMGQLRRLYGMTLADYDTLIAKQNYMCAICFSKVPLDNSEYFHIDHCHKTGVVRGLLCGLCNKGLGCFKDDSELLQQAIKYLHELLAEKEK